MSVQGNGVEVLKVALLSFCALLKKREELNTLNDYHSYKTIGESLFTLFASYICLSLYDDANKMKTLNIERA